MKLCNAYDKYWPVANEIGFVECEVDQLVAWYINWKSRRGKTPHVRSIPERFPYLLNALFPLSMPTSRKIIFVPTSSSWTAFFSNSANGNNATAARFYARSLGCRGLRFVCSAERQGDEKYRGWPARIFSLYDGRSLERDYSRTVEVMYDGYRWSFEQFGGLLNAEDPAAYRRRRVKDRFLCEELVELVASLGIFPLDEHFFYGTEAVLCVDQDPPRSNERSFTQEELREFRMKPIRAWDRRNGSLPGVRQEKPG